MGIAILSNKSFVKDGWTKKTNVISFVHLNYLYFSSVLESNRYWSSRLLVMLMHVLSFFIFFFFLVIVISMIWAFGVEDDIDFNYRRGIMNGDIFRN